MGWMDGRTGKAGEEDENAGDLSMHCKRTTKEKKVRRKKENAMLHTKQDSIDLRVF